ncbi:hypothetical protein D3C81_1901390 [compost metagenome]
MPTIIPAITARNTVKLAANGLIAMTDTTIIAARAATGTDTQLPAGPAGPAAAERPFQQRSASQATLSASIPLEPARKSP